MTLADLLRGPRHIIVATFPDGAREDIPGRHYTEADATRHLPHVKNMLNGRYRYADLDVQLVASRRDAGDMRVGVDTRHGAGRWAA